MGGKIIVTVTSNHLIVEDTGIGIAEENMDKIFSRFFTVDKSHSGKNGGFGLGLAVAKKICGKSGWKMNLESELGVVDAGLETQLRAIENALAGKIKES